MGTQHLLPRSAIIPPADPLPDSVITWTSVIGRDRWYLGLNYGEFYPEYIGNPLQDVNIRRGMLKFNYWFTPQLQSFNMLMLETSGQIAQLGQPRNGVVVLTGLQFTFCDRRTKV